MCEWLVNGKAEKVSRYISELEDKTDNTRWWRGAKKEETNYFKALNLNLKELS